MQKSGYEQRTRTLSRPASRDVRELDREELRALVSSYKCRIARRSARESDFQALLSCQRELSRRL